MTITKTPKQINAERESRGLPPLNFKLIEKVIKRIEAKPETYAQQVWHGQADKFNDSIEEPGPLDGRPRLVPSCGAVACMAGEAVICSALSVAKGLRLLVDLSDNDEVFLHAQKLLGLDDDETDLFDGDAGKWIEPFRSQFRNAKTYKGEARAAINYLRYILRTGKVTE